MPPFAAQSLLRSTERRAATRLDRPSVRLVALTVTVVLALSLAGVTLALRAYGGERRQIQLEARSLAVLAAENANRILSDRLTLLETIAAAPVVVSGDPNAIQSYFAFLASAQPSLRRLAWIDLYGVRRATALPESPTANPLVRDADFFRTVVLTQEPWVGGVIVSPVDGEYEVPMAAPTRDANGGLTGVIVAGLNTTEIAKTMSRINAAKGSALLVVDRSGRLITAGETALTPLDLSTTPLLATARAQGDGIELDAVGPLGGQDRMVAYSTAPAGHWLLMLDSPAQAAFAPARRTLTLELAALVTMALAGIIGSVIAGRQLDRTATGQRRALLQSEALAAENAVLYDQARAAVTQRDEFLTLISHDLKTPLTAVKIQTQLLQRLITAPIAPDRSRLITGLSAINDTTTYMGAMITELLDVALLQAGRPLELDRQQVDLTALLDRVVAEQGVAESHQLISNLPPEPVTGCWDSVRLERALDNVLSNAVKYTPPGGTITVQLRRLDGDTLPANTPPAVMVEVADTGIGIPERDLPRVFEQFHRGANVVGRIEGSGVGLAGARRIIEQHGGNITVHSREGSGTTILIRLPLTPPAPH